MDTDPHCTALNPTAHHGDAGNTNSSASSVTSVVEHDESVDPGTKAQERGNRISIVSMVVGAVIALAVGAASIAANSVMRGDKPPPVPSLTMVPEECDLSICRESRPLAYNFTAGRKVHVSVYAPTAAVFIDEELVAATGTGSLSWSLSWQDGMAEGPYQVEVTDETTNQTTNAQVRFVRDTPSSTLKPVVTLRQGLPKTGSRNVYYDVVLANFVPGTTVQIRCHDSQSVDFKTVDVAIDAGGLYSDPKLCSTPDGPLHWVDVVADGQAYGSVPVTWPPSTGGGSGSASQPSATSETRQPDTKPSGGELPGKAIEVTYVRVGTDVSKQEALDSISSANRRGLSPTFALETGGQWLVVTGPIVDSASLEKALSAFPSYESKEIVLGTVCPSAIGSPNGSVVEC